MGCCATKDFGSEATTPNGRGSRGTQRSLDGVVPLGTNQANPFNASSRRILNDPESPRHGLESPSTPLTDYHSENARKGAEALRQFVQGAVEPSDFSGSCDIPEHPNMGLDETFPMLLRIEYGNEISEFDEDITRTRSGKEVRETKRLKRGTDAEGNKTINEYVVVGDLGSGAYGKVKLVIDSDSDSPYAVKILERSMLERVYKSGGRTAFDNVLMEIAIMKKLDHPNIVQLHEVIDDGENDKLYLILEYVERGQIGSSGDDGTIVSLQKLRRYFPGILSGLSYLHRQHIFHQDIKPENILIDAQDMPKLTDFGSSYFSSSGDDDDDARQGFDGTLSFISPEACREGTSVKGGPADVWALGVTLYVLAFGKLPFNGASLPELSKSILNDPLTFPIDIPSDFSDILSKMLHKDPECRIGVKGMMSHPFGGVERILPSPRQSDLIQPTPDELGKAVRVGEGLESASAFSLERLTMIVRLKAHFRHKREEVQRRLSGSHASNNGDPTSPNPPASTNLKGASAYSTLNQPPEMRGSVGVINRGANRPPPYPHTQPSASPPRLSGPGGGTKPPARGVVSNGGREPPGHKNAGKEPPAQGSVSGGSGGGGAGGGFGSSRGNSPQPAPLDLAKWESSGSPTTTNTKGPARIDPHSVARELDFWEKEESPHSPGPTPKLQVQMPSMAHITSPNAHLSDSGSFCGGGGFPRISHSLSFGSHLSSPGCNSEASDGESACSSFCASPRGDLPSEQEVAGTGGVAAMVREASATGSTELMLNGQRMPILPTIVTNYSCLTKLTCFKNDMSTLPPSIGALVNLTELVLGGNKLESLPDEIGELSSLCLLDLNHNHLTSLPPSLLGCISLERLILDYNALMAFPSIALSLPHLTELRLAENKGVDRWPDDWVGVLQDFTELRLGLDNTPALVSQWSRQATHLQGVSVDWNTIYPNAILEGLYLGGLRSAQTEGVFRALGITHVLTVGKGLEIRRMEGMSQLALDVDDINEESLTKYFEEGSDFIKGARAGGGAVLVHCFAGLSRSPTMVAAYLIRDCQMTFGEAMGVIQKNRPAVNPNAGFRQQLAAYEKRLGRVPTDFVSEELQPKFIPE